MFYTVCIVLRWIEFKHMLLHPTLINRPVVVIPPGTRLCQPSERVPGILPEIQKGTFTTEDGEKVIDEPGKRIK